MKKMLLYPLLLVVLMLALSSCAPEGQGVPVEIPDDLTQALTLFLEGGIIWLVVAGAKGLLEVFGIEFSTTLAKTVTAIGAVVAGAVVTTIFGTIQIVLGNVDVTYAPIVQQVLILLMAVFTAFGIQRQSKPRALPKK